MFGPPGGEGGGLNGRVFLRLPDGIPEHPGRRGVDEGGRLSLGRVPDRGSEQRIDRLPINLGSTLRAIERGMNDRIAPFRRLGVGLRHR